METNIIQSHPKFKITNHHELRRSYPIDCSKPKRTDQSFKNSCDINIIMAQYAKTGLLPQQNSSTPRYIDNTTIPNLEQAFNVVNTAHNLFYDLPPTIRKLMDNDPSQLENFINNPQNKQLLINEGLLIEKPTIVEQKTQVITPPTDKVL
nr:MAG: internal scaffolding protein [Microvirus sp.]